MIAALRGFIDNIRGTGEAALTIPSLDGAFKPNMGLDNAEVLVKWHAPPDNIAMVGEFLYFSSGGALLRESSSGEVEVVAEGDAVVTAIGATPEGVIVARSGRGMEFYGREGKRVHFPGPDPSEGDISALAVLSDGRVAVAIGSRLHLAAEWRRDFMQRGRSGSIWVCDPAVGTRQVADGLAYPFGIASDPEGSLLISIAWDCRLVKIDPHGRQTTVLNNLPGYPSRIVPASGGGYWLALFALRNQLVEFVLRERGYRERMMQEIEPRHWVCPALSPADSPLDVMQEGAQKIGGSIKPWAPSLSYGLIARIGADLLPDYSWHSRANGGRHGITSLCEHDGRVLATSRGGGVVIGLAIDHGHPIE